MNTPRFLRVLPILLAAAGCAHPGRTSGREATTGEAVIRAMHATYARHWYRTMTFVQRTKFRNTPDQTWYESVRTPGGLRIDIAPLDSQNTLLFRADSLYRYRRGQITSRRAYVHSLAVLISDVFVQPPDSSIKRLRALGFDLSRVQHAQWNDRGVWIVGAAAGDTTTAQFWIDTERRYLVRMIERDPNGSRLDTHVGGHVRAGNIWYETAIQFYVNGTLTQEELYSQVRLNPPLDSQLFEPGVWMRPSWIVESR